MAPSQGPIQGTDCIREATNSGIKVIKVTLLASTLFKNINQTWSWSDEGWLNKLWGLSLFASTCLRLALFALPWVSSHSLLVPAQTHLQNYKLDFATVPLSFFCILGILFLSLPCTSCSILYYYPSFHRNISWISKVFTKPTNSWRYTISFITETHRVFCTATALYCTMLCFSNILVDFISPPTSAIYSTVLAGYKILLHA